MEGGTGYRVGLAPRCQQMSFIEQMLRAGHGSPDLRISISPESIGPALQVTVLRLSQSLPWGRQSFAVFLHSEGRVPIPGALP